MGTNEGCVTEDAVRTLNDGIEPILHNASNLLQELCTAIDLWALELDDGRPDATAVAQQSRMLFALIRRQQDALDDVRDVVAMRDGTLELSLYSTDLLSILRAALRLVTPEVWAMPAEFAEIVPPCALPLVNTDPARLRRLLTSLLGTVLRAAQSAGALEGVFDARSLPLTFSHDDAVVCVAVPLVGNIADTAASWHLRYQELLERLQIDAVIDNGMVRLSIPCADAPC